VKERDIYEQIPDVQGCSGKLDPEEFTNADIVKLFGVDGVRMLTIDTITGNGDRPDMRRRIPFYAGNL
jgi:hypothetical protein